MCPLVKVVFPVPGKPEVSEVTVWEEESVTVQVTVSPLLMEMLKPEEQPERHQLIPWVAAEAGVTRKELRRARRRRRSEAGLDILGGAGGRGLGYLLFFFGDTRKEKGFFFFFSGLGKKEGIRKVI